MPPCEVGRSGPLHDLLPSIKTRPEQNTRHERSDSTCLVVGQKLHEQCHTLAAFRYYAPICIGANREEIAEDVYPS